MPCPVTGPVAESLKRIFDPLYKSRNAPAGLR
jgi:hypothetical protein